MEENFIKFVTENFSDKERSYTRVTYLKGIEK